MNLNIFLYFQPVIKILKVIIAQTIHWEEPQYAIHYSLNVSSYKLEKSQRLAAIRFTQPTLTSPNSHSSKYHISDDVTCPQIVSLFNFSTMLSPDVIYIHFTKWHPLKDCPNKRLYKTTSLVTTVFSSFNIHNRKAYNRDIFSNQNRIKFSATSY